RPTLTLTRDRLVRSGRHPDRLRASRLRERDSPPHGRRRGRCLRRRRWHPYLAFPQGSSSGREGGGLWPHVLAARRPTGVGPSRSSSSLSRYRHLRGVHRRRVASPGTETGAALHHSVAPTAPARPPSPATHLP